MSVQQAENIRKKQGVSSSKLEKIRVSRNLSQSELANKSGVPIRRIQSYEQQVKNIDGAKISTLIDLCLGLNCGLEDILEDETTINKLNLLFEALDENIDSENINISNDFEKEKELYTFFFDNENIAELTEDQKNGIKFVLLDFSQRWRDILELRYKKELSLKQIGKIHNITSERTRQIILKALEKLETLKISEYVVYGFQSWHKKSISEEINRDIFEISIEEMNLSGRAYNCLMRAGLTTVGKVKMLTEKDLLNMKNMGQSAVDEIINKLKQYN